MYEYNVKPVYEEAPEAGQGYREAYLAGIDTLIERRRAEVTKARHAFGETIARDREAARAEFLRMLGWPLTQAPAPILSVKEIPVFEDGENLVTRVVLEIFEGLPFYGILFRHKTEKPLPLVISQHGGGGTPELCSSFFHSANYNDMTLRIYGKGVNVFAPQLLLWREEFGPENRRQELDNSLKQIGSSITALEVYGLMRVLDHFENAPWFDGRFGMAGLSYGGFYTLFAAAAEPRLRANLASCQFNDRFRHNWSDWVWFGAGERFLDAEIGALVCPRYLCIEVGEHDKGFTPDPARAEYEVLKGYYAEAPDQLRFCVFDGAHEFDPTGENVEDFIAALLR